MTTALFFGSFNPIHIGHLALAQYALNFADVDEVWLVVSPHNPFKSPKDLAPADTRLRMAQLATADDERIKVVDVEMRMPQPSYSIKTIDVLESQYPDRNFSIMMGDDNLDGLPKWREAERLIDGRTFIVYPRPGYRPDPTPVTKMGGIVKRLDAPQIDISSTMIRQWLSEGKSIRHFVPDVVLQLAESTYAIPPSPIQTA